MHLFTMRYYSFSFASADLFFSDLPSIFRLFLFLFVFFAGAVTYCSKACQRQHWAQEGGHKKRCNSKNPLANPYFYQQAEINYRTLRFCVDDFQAGPDQPLDPPAGDDYELARELWK